MKTGVSLVRYGGDIVFLHGTTNETGELYVGREAPKDVENWTQDEDVLDTWFSSALWPFSTMGWPNTEDPMFKDISQLIH